VTEDDAETIQRAPQKHNHPTYTLPVINIFKQQTYPNFVLCRLKIFFGLSCLSQPVTSFGVVKNPVQENNKMEKLH
jgi:hypothetical protein